MNTNPTSTSTDATAWIGLDPGLKRLGAALCVVDGEGRVSARAVWMFDIVGADADSREGAAATGKKKGKWSPALLAAKVDEVLAAARDAAGSARGRVRACIENQFAGNFRLKQVQGALKQQLESARDVDVCEPHAGTKARHFGFVSLHGASTSAAYHQRKREGPRAVRKWIADHPDDVDAGVVRAFEKRRKNPDKGLFDMADALLMVLAHVSASDGRRGGGSTKNPGRIAGARQRRARARKVDAEATGPDAPAPLPRVASAHGSSRDDPIVL